MSKFGLNIGEAVKAMRDNECVARSGWNGKNMYLYLNPRSGDDLEYVVMRTAQGAFVPWTCSQTDLLAQDWFIFEKETLKNG